MNKMIPSFQAQMMKNWFYEFPKVNRLVDAYIDYIMTCKNFYLAEKAAEELRTGAPSEIIVKKPDLANLDSVRKLAKEVNLSMILD